MASENGSLVNGERPASKAAPSRVAQISKKLKSSVPSVPFIGEKKKAAVQKRPAPVLPSEARAAAEKPLELNLYATKMAKG